MPSLLSLLQPFAWRVCKIKNNINNTDFFVSLMKAKYCNLIEIKTQRGLIDCSNVALQITLITFQDVYVFFCNLLSSFFNDWLE